MNREIDQKRRRFLGMVGIAALAPMTANAKTVVSLLDAPATARWQRMTHTDFSKMIGQKFTLQSGEETIRIRLAKVELGKNFPGRPAWLPRQQPFSAVFHSIDSDNIELTDVTVSHPQLGSTKMLLSELGSSVGKTGLKLETVFG